MKYLKYQLLLIFVFGVLSTTNAQFQRMGIKRGTKLTIKGNSKGKINTYCMDYTLDSPTSGATYKKY